MRFLVIVPASKESEAGVLPDEKIIADMQKFNEEMVKAGVMLSGEGLHPTSKGARIRFSGGYVGGTICTAWRVGDPSFMQTALGILVWLGLYLRESRLKALIPLRKET